MPFDDIRSRIADAIAHEQRTASFSQHLERAAATAGVRVPPEQIRQTVTAVRAYVENVPALLEGISFANDPGLRDRFAPAVRAVERAFLAAPPLIPDESGLVGLLDNAYLAYGIVIGLPGTEAPPDLLEFHRMIRGVIGEPLATQLDGLIASTFEAPDAPLEAPGSSAVKPPAAGPTVGPSGSFRAMAPPRLVPVRSVPVQGPSPPEGGEGPGALDPGFGRDGVVVTRLQGALLHGMAVLEDGRIVVAGTSTNDNGDTGVTIARYRVDGKPDTSFAKTGCVRLDLEKRQDAAGHAVVVQPDGRIVIAGVADPPHDELVTREELAIARLTEDGALDPSFGHGGWAQLSSLVASRAEAVALQPDRRIVVAGSVAGGGGPAFAIIRLTPEGGLDPSFGDSGLCTFGSGAASAVVVQADGKIVAAGTVNGKILIVRLTPSGRPDTGYADGGRLTVDVGGADPAVGSIVVDLEGRVLLAGGLNDPRGKYILLRLAPDGALDPDFAGRGVLIDEFRMQDPEDPKGVRSGVSWAHGVAVQPDGRILLAGRVVRSTRSIGYVSMGVASGEAVARNTSFAVARFTADGAPDATFGDRGIVVTDLGEDEDEARALGLQPDGGIVVAGRSEGRGFALVRYRNRGGPPVTEAELAEPVAPLVRDARPEHRDGRLDPAFAGGGAAFVDFGVPSTARALVLDPDGRILVAGEGGPLEGDAGLDIALARLEADGTPDRTFGAGGRTLVGVSGRDIAHAIAVRPDGRILVAGEALGGAREGVDFLLVQLDPNGTVDPAFGEGGVVLTDFFGGSDDRAYALALQADGKVVAAGYSTVHGPPRREVFALARYRRDGTLDPDFGKGGLVVPPFPSDFARARAVCVQPDGKIVAAGPVHSGRGDTPYDFAVIRLLSDGALDESFGDGGIAMVDLPGTDDTPHAIALQPDGGIVVAGEAMDEATDRLHFLVVRLDPSGRLDPRFSGTGGALLEEFQGGAYGIAVQPDGKVLAVGFTRATEPDASANERVALVRLTPDGAPDPTFGDGGLTTVGLGGQKDRGCAVSLQGDGRIVVGATSTSGGDSGFAVVRFESAPGAGGEGG